MIKKKSIWKKCCKEKKYNDKKRSDLIGKKLKNDEII